MSDTEGGDAATMPEPAKDTIKDLKTRKRVLKTKLTRARFELTKRVGLSRPVTDINTILDIINLLNDEVYEVLEALQVSDADNGPKYDEELEELQNTCGEVIKIATKYIQDKTQSAHTVTVPTTSAGSGKVYERDVNRDMLHQLKRVSIVNFSGNKSEYKMFRDAFEECVDKSSSTPSYKMLQLRQHLKGDALKSIEGLPASEIGYETALKKLEKKYGGERRYLLMHLDNIRTMKPIQAGDLKQLEDFTDKLELAIVSLQENHRADEFRADSMFYCVVKSKMPATYVAHYKRWLGSISRPEKITSLLEWLDHEIKIRNESLEEGQKFVNSSVKVKPKTYVAHEERNSRNNKPSDRICPVCTSGEHSIRNCNQFISLPVSQRWAVAKENRCCYRCLAPGGSHRGSDCRNSRTCSAEGCHKTHHRLLHDDRSTARPTFNADAPEFTPQNSDRFTGVEGHTHTSSRCNDLIAMRTVPVIVTNAAGREVTLNALLDECSTDSYVSEHVAAQLGLKGNATSRMVSVLGGKATEIKGRKVSIELLRSTDRKNLGKIESFTVQKVTGDIECVNWNEYRSKYGHLRHITFPRMATPRVVDMLIGLNDDALQLHSSLKEVHGLLGEPIARLTPLGWTCIGHVPSKDHACHVTNISQTYFATDSCEVGLTEVLKRTWEIDNQGLQPTDMSPTDRRIDKAIGDKIQLTEGRYQVPIPWKEGEPNLPNNWKMAASRLRSMEKSLWKRPTVAAEYKRIIDDHQKKGYVRKLSTDEVNSEKTPGWYLPHFPIVRPDKTTTKVRIVMDAAAKCDDKSLNDCIHQGPKLQSDLMDVLIRTRRRPIALSADISEMFLQVELRPEDRKYHRFLWRNMDVNQPIEAYEFNRLVFGNTASPYLSQKVIRSHAEKNTESYPRGAEALLNAMYVDDLTDSEDDTESAIELRKQVTELLEKAGFKIRKWISNDIGVLVDIPENERATCVNIEDGELPSVKTLGLTWNAESDKYVFVVKMPTLTEMTKRSVFSASATLFDPLNFLAPFTIRSRILMQECWVQGLKWDEPLPETMTRKWTEWFDEIASLSDIEIDRCLVLKSKVKIKNRQLHTFGDASRDAYATAVYLRTEYENGEVCINLVTSKARVAPLKAMSIPRLELCGAVLGAKLSQTVAHILDITKTDVVYWTDSMNVLFWINGASRTYKPFVASRVGLIHDLSEPEQWRYVPTKLNSADIPTRGMTVNELKTCQRWWNGPEFLKNDEEEWPKRPTIDKTEEANKEIRAANDVTLVAKKTVGLHRNDLGRLDPKRYSDWTKLIRVTAWVHRFIGNTQKNQDKNTAKHLTVTELEQAKKFWYKQAQKEEFADDLTDLKLGHSVKKQSKLLTLNPRIDDDGLLRVDGRLKQGQHLAYDARFPIILPRDHDITRLVITHYDKLGDHARGRNHLLSDSRTKYWIIRGREAIRSVQGKCPGCKRRRIKIAGQIMAPLPKFRLGDPLRCFARTGLDYAGPFLTKQGRFKQRAKRYLCVFTCLASRAVHLEMAYALDTDSFLNALSRFCDRRNRPIQIVSDNGTNFVGGERELKELVNSLDQNKIANETANHGIEWSFNPPGSPHFGGVFESMVKSAKRAIGATLSNANLTDEELHTVITGAESLINSRPLTGNSADPLDCNVLTPNHFLFGQLGGRLAPESIENDVNPRQRWRRVQEVIGHFWKRWIREFLPNLQTRIKWQKPQENMKADDVVVVISNESPRGTWPLGRIVEVFPGPDGHVRVVNVRIGDKVYKRPVHRLYKLQ